MILRENDNDNTGYDYSNHDKTERKLHQIGKLQVTVTINGIQTRF